MLFVAHDLDLAAVIADRVAVMYAGRIVETGSAEHVFAEPKHPYTAALLAAKPRLDAPGERLAVIPGRVPDLRIPIAGCPFAARCAHADARCAAERPISVSVPGRTGAAVACWHSESLTLQGGSVDGSDHRGAGTTRRGDRDGGRAGEGSRHAEGRAERLRRARQIQMVFQDPFLSLDPRICVAGAITETLRLHHPGIDHKSRVAELLGHVGLGDGEGGKLPRQLAAGVRPRSRLGPRAIAAARKGLAATEAESRAEAAA